MLDFLTYLFQYTLGCLLIRIPVVRIFIGVLSVLMIFTGIFQAQKIFFLELSGLRAEGQVLKENYNHSGNNFYYYPVVGYETANHQHIEFQDEYGSPSPSHHIGDKVTILYLARAPQKEVVIDRGPWTWLTSLKFIGVGALLFWLLRSAKRRNDVT